MKPPLPARAYLKDDVLQPVAEGRPEGVGRVGVAGAVEHDRFGAGAEQGLLYHIPLRHTTIM